MNLLALDAATDACSAALLCRGALCERFELAPRRHADLLLPMIDELLATAGIAVTMLDGIAFGAGPGAFTGLRIAAAFTQGIAFAHDLPVAPVSSLAALALDAVERHPEHSICAAFDARMGEVYCGGYAADTDCLIRCVLTESVCAPERIPCPDTGNWIGCGIGWSVYEAPMRAAFTTAGARLVAVDAEHYPHAAAIARLGERILQTGGGVAAELALPTYLRDKVTG